MLSYDIYKIKLQIGSSSVQIVCELLADGHIDSAIFCDILHNWLKRGRQTG